MTRIPSYLEGYEQAYRNNPREAARQWFRDAKYGLFLHYGLYSLLGGGSGAAPYAGWVQFYDVIPVAEYGKLADNFAAEKFDANWIADFAVECGMKYINFTTRHHEGFSLFHTNQSDFHIGNSAAKRDLVREMAEACEARGLGLCLYYSHARDWRHPHAPNIDEWDKHSRPHYDPPDPHYKYGDEHDISVYVDFVANQIEELLLNYGPVAAIWLDGKPRQGDFSQFRCQDLYNMIHAIQPQVLVSYKRGVLGTEDFFAPERDAIDQDRSRPMEICETMNPKSWGYMKADAGKHKTAAEVWEVLRSARANECNLLLNTGPLPAGDLDSEDVEAMLAVGGRIRTEGFPE